MDTQSAALEYAARGWAVFAAGAKAPIKGTRGFKDATTNRQLLIAAWKRNPEANVGIRTGVCSGLIVVDVDPRHGGDDSLHELQREYEALPDTVSALTGGGGAHLFFQAPTQPVKTSTIREGLDIRAEDAYVIAAPSVHESGRAYEWENAPDDLDPAPAPEWLLALLRTRQTGRFRAPRSVPAGERNAMLVRLAGSLSRAGVVPEGIHAALTAQNQKTCTPPLSDDEIARIARKARLWEAAPWMDMAAFVTDARLRPADRILLVVLALATRSDGIARMGYRRIHERTGIRIPVIGSHLRALERAGLIEILPSDGPGTRNAYRVLSGPSVSPGVTRKAP